MNVTILEIMYKNIRNFKNIKLSLQKNDNENYKMSLIMMPNGTGKTTTLDLLRLLLNQKAENLTKSEILSYRPVGGEIDKGQFGVKIRVEDKIYGLYMVFDYQNISVEYKTSLVSGTKGGKRKGWVIEDLKDDFTEEFVNRFVFDGELANQMLSLDQSEAENAIKYLYGLDKINTINTVVDDLLQERINNADRQSKTTTDKGLNRIKNEYEKYSNKKKELSGERSQLKTNLRRYKKQYEEQNKRYEALISNQEELINDRRDLEDKLRENKSVKADKIKKIASEIRKPENLSVDLKNKLNNLHKNLKVLKLPKNISKQFFCDLAESDKCICGRDIGSKEKKYILSEADQYLGEESIGFLNAMKEGISNVKESSDLYEVVNSVMECSNNTISIQNKIDKVVAEIDKNGGKDTRKIKARMDDIRTKIIECEMKLDIIESKDNDDERLNANNNIYLCEMKIKEAKAKLGDAVGVKNYIDSCDLLKSMIKNIEYNTLEKLKKRIIEDTNIRIANVIDRDNIQIDKIEGGISIKDRKGVSVGQALSVVYCFIGTMFEKSLKKLPFIIDSPCNSLDLEVRANIAKIIPGLFNQIIVFIISSEKASFVENLDVAEEDLQFLTVYKEKKDSEEVKLISGYEFFDKFQEDESNGL